MHYFNQEVLHLVVQPHEQWPKQGGGGGCAKKGVQHHEAHQLWGHTPQHTCKAAEKGVNPEAYLFTLRLRGNIESHYHHHSSFAAGCTQRWCQARSCSSLMLSSLWGGGAA